MARREPIPRAMVVVEKYICANVRAEGPAGAVDEHIYALHECFGAQFYGAHLDSCCFGAVVIVAGFADLCLVHVF